MILKGRILDACLAFCAIAAPLMLINFYEAAPIVASVDTPSDSMFRNPVLARTGGSSANRAMAGAIAGPGGP